MRIVNGEGFARTRHGSRGETEERKYGRDRVDRCSSPESASNDIANLLPSDPFGMDIETTLTAITGWLEDLDVNYRGYVRNNDCTSSQDDRDWFSRWNLIWKNATKFQSLSSNVQFDKLNMDIRSIPSNLQGDKNLNRCILPPPDNTHLYEKLNMGNALNPCSEEREMGGASSQYIFGFEPTCNTGGIVGLGNESTSCSSGLQFREKAEGAESVAKEEVPHGALGFALSYLGVKDLLSVERVCRSVNMGNALNPCSEEREMGGASTQYIFGFEPTCNTGGIVGLGNESTSCSSGLQFREKAEGAESVAKEEVPHVALGFALSYLGVKDLLSVERVCRSLCSTVQGDPLLWRTINIDQPLNKRITDDVLLQLATRAQGNLQCLSLVECPRITDDGVRRVLETNPLLNKLCVPGCRRLTIEGILNNLKAFNSDKGVHGIKHLRIGGLYGVTHEHFGELKRLLGADNDKLQNHHKPHFYHREIFYLMGDDDRAIDIEMCPRCEKVRLLYDCTAKSCQVEDNAAQVCRACTLCISRCVQCGRCFKNTEYEENFCLELICSDCFKQPDRY